ncbi:MAG TPA: HAD family hydrolase, partial [Candidatus Moranbacteria bacterium]|nr:HAD family hydrolase [Candidatus Moranbacteria bacterium]
MISDGLTSEEARKKLEKYGFNKIDEKKENFLRKVFHWFLSPISLMLLGAASLSLFSGKKFDFYFILILILINFFVAFWQERKADNAIKKLQEHLSVKVNVKRDGKWKTVDSSNLVPGDLIRLNVGDIVSADVSILAASNLFINEAVLTGESLPQEKKDGDKVFSGAFVVTGQGEARVTATGKNTYFNKTLLAVEKSEKRSILETDIMLIAKFLALLSISAVTILTLFFLLRGEKILELTTIALSLIIAGIPISLPTVITLIISLGVLSLAKKGSIVRRISSLEDLANVDLLFTDKTGTLTKNEIQAGKIIPYGASEKDVLFFSFLAEAGNETNPINRAIIKRAKESGSIEQDYKIINFIPADSERKRSTTYAVVGGEKITVSSGAPQIIESLCDLSDDQKIVLRKDIQSAADEGHRAILVAVNKSGHKEEKMKLVGMILLSDTLYPGTRKIIRFLEDSGMEVRMVTGDHRGIAQKIGREVGLMEKQIYYEVLPGEKYQ